MTMVFCQMVFCCRDVALCQVAICRVALRCKDFYTIYCRVYATQTVHNYRCTMSSVFLNLQVTKFVKFQYITHKRLNLKILFYTSFIK